MYMLDVNYVRPNVENNLYVGKGKGKEKMKDYYFFFLIRIFSSLCLLPKLCKVV